MDCFTSVNLYRSLRGLDAWIVESWIRCCFETKRRQWFRDTLPKFSVVKLTVSVWRKIGTTSVSSARWVARYISKPARHDPAIKCPETNLVLDWFKDGSMNSGNESIVVGKCILPSLGFKSTSQISVSRSCRPCLSRQRMVGDRSVVLPPFLTFWRNCSGISVPSHRKNRNVVVKYSKKLTIILPVFHSNTTTARTPLS